MNTTTVVFIALAGIAMLVDWWSVSSGRIRFERIAKPTVMIALISAASVIEMDPPALRPWILVALTAGLVGDVMLLPDVDRFVLGLGAFLLGHVAYVIALSLMWNPGWLVALGIVALVLLMTALAVPILRAVFDTPMFWPVVAYIAVSAGVVLVASETGRWTVFVGALIFAISDSVLGHDRFVTDTDRHRTLVHITYHLGQSALLLGTIT